ncbi:MAG: diguanylate cyclase [Sphingomonadales bacterium]|nr:diguanylate cyclase [Sphingomonadales bacterium]
MAKVIFWARLGGDEFAVMMAGEDSADRAIRLAQACTNGGAVSCFRAPDHVRRQYRHCNRALPDGQTAEALQRNADPALYCAEDSGRGCWNDLKTAWMWPCGNVTPWNAICGTLLRLTNAALLPAARRCQHGQAKWL